MKKFYLMKLNNEEVKEHYQVEISKVSAALEILDNNLEINRAWRRCEYKIFSQGEAS
jgi:hypothetical protein